MRTAPDFPTAVDAAKRGEAVMVQCPAHDDNMASLSVGPGTEQPVIFKCHAQCEAEDIVSASGMTWADVCEPIDTSATDNEWTPRGPASHVYSYQDEYGTELFQTLRIPLAGGGKTFMQRHRDGDRWAWNLQEVRRVLYRLPHLIEAAKEGRDIWIVEGEKDVHRAEADGKVATTSPMGAGKWDESYGRFLAGSFVTIVSDNDEPGRKHARMVADDLVANHSCDVRIVETPLEKCKDYTDHRQHGGTDEMFLVTWTSYAPPVPNDALGIQTFLDTDFPEGKVLIPGMLAEANVAVLVGEEGHGKSLLMRQMAVQCAVGLVPFTLQPMEPLKVLYIDAENPEFQQMIDWRRLAGLAARHAGHPVPNENLLIMSEWRNEPDLTTPDGMAWLCERVNAHRPQVVFMGPVQNLVGRDTKDDEVVRKFKAAVNNARAICGTAFVIEHHAPLRQPGDKVRQMRPYGSSLFMKWPDYGYGLKQTEDEGTYDMHPFRRPRVRERAWPEQVRWGKPGTMEFPWEQSFPEAVDSSNVRPMHGA